MLDELQKIFRTLTKSFEVLLVLEDKKPVARILADEKDIGAYISFFEKNNIKYRISDFKIIKDAETRTKYSNKGFRIDKDMVQKGDFFIYISKDMELSKKTKQFEHQNSHIELGKILGYPECCCNFFEKKFEEESKKANDYVLAALKESKGNVFPFWNNIAIRHMDISLLSHFPCNFDCKKSENIAKDNFDILKRYSKRYASIFEDMLKGVVIYTEDQGIFLLEDYKIAGKDIVYNKIIEKNDSEICESLEKNDTLKIIDKNKIKLGEKEFNAGIMIFI